MNNSKCSNFDHDALRSLPQGIHEIYVRDPPIIGFASRPAQSSAARTAAHELGMCLACIIVRIPMII